MSSATPADGASFARRGGVALPWEIKGGVKSGRAMRISIAVSTQNVVGQDGTLADDYMADFFNIYESDAEPGRY